MLIAFAIALLCGVGFYVSLFMYRKWQRASLGRLAEPSVVESPRARAIAGIPNAAFGLAYYPALAVTIPLLGIGPVRAVALTASVAAAALSLYLAYSLLAVTRMPCPYCWAGHVINWSLPLLIWWSR
jgi:uncharacterized membrane protein